MRNLSEIRTEIDSIDEQIIELFKKRMDCAKEVGNYKKANNIPVLNQARENEILDAIEERGGEYGSYARLLYSNIMELSRALQHNIYNKFCIFFFLQIDCVLFFRNRRSRLYSCSEYNRHTVCDTAENTAAVVGFCYNFAVFVFKRIIGL